MAVSTASIGTRLAAGGRRRTAQRVVVAEALASAKRALSAQELYERIRETHPTIGRATVYRARGPRAVELRRSWRGPRDSGRPSARRTHLSARATAPVARRLR